MLYQSISDSTTPFKLENIFESVFSLLGDENMYLVRDCILGFLNSLILVLVVHNKSI